MTFIYTYNYTRLCQLFQVFWSILCDFLFDFVKNNVAQRIQNACTKENFMNIINFFNHYSNSYDSMFAEVLYTFAREDLFETMKSLYYHGNNAQKAYAVKYFTYLSKELQKSILPDIRRTALSKYEPLAINSIELLSIMNDEISKSQAIEKARKLIDDGGLGHTSSLYINTITEKDLLPGKQ